MLFTKLFIELHDLFELSGELRDIHDANIIQIARHKKRRGLKNFFFSPR